MSHSQLIKRSWESLEMSKIIRWSNLYSIIKLRMTLIKNERRLWVLQEILMFLNWAIDSQNQLEVTESQLIILVWLLIRLNEPCLTWMNTRTITWLKRLILNRRLRNHNKTTEWDKPFMKQTTKLLKASFLKDLWARKFRVKL